MDEQIYSEMAALEDKHWWFAARRKILGEQIAKLQLPKDADILEAGCGSGGNFNMLAQHGQVFAMETNAQALAFAAAKSSVQIASGRLPEAIPFADRKFNLIVLLDVMEHLDEDSASLRALRTRLKPGGWLLITVPAYQFLWSHHDELHHHKRRYVAASLRNVVAGAGLSMQYLSYFNTWLFPLIAAVRLTGSGNKDSGNLTMPNKFINALLMNIFSSERLLLGRLSLPFGVSLLAVTQNSESERNPE